MKKVLFFDFDGVLLDSHGIFESYFIKNHNYTKESFSKVFHSNIFENKKISSILKQDKENLDTHFFSSVDGTSFYEGVVEFLDFCKQHYNLFIISSGPTKNILSHLSYIRKENIFKEILGGDFHKSKKKKFEHLLKKYDFKKEDILFITDSLGDIREANEIPLKTIGVTWGAHFRNTLEQGNPFKIVDSIQELQEEIKKELPL